MKRDQRQIPRGRTYPGTSLTAKMGVGATSDAQCVEQMCVDR